MSDPKIGFITSVKLGFSCMEAIYESGQKISLAITLPNDVSKKKSGRVLIDSFCNEKKIPLLKVLHINQSEVVEKIKEFKIDWLFIIGWSQIANKALVSAALKGTIGAHPTLLPVGRGRASLPWVILKNLKETGVTFFKLGEGVDDGPIIFQNKIKVSSEETATTLYSKIVSAHKNIIKKLAPILIENNLKTYDQNETLATFWPGRKPNDSEINLNESIWKAERLIRAVTKPYPGAFYIENKKKIIIWKAHVLNQEPSNKDNKYLKFNDGYLVLDNFEEINLSK
jgi:methionyl-tRNA formyltransferase